MSTGPGDLRLSGAVDLSALANRQSAQSAAPTSSPYVVDVSEATFQQEVLDRSQQVPVLLDFWAAWCGPCKQLSPVLERLAVEANGTWVLAKIDVDANQRLAAAARVQSIPTVMAVVGGQIMPLFTGALPEQQVRAALQEVQRVAGEMLGGAPAGEQGGTQPAEDSAYAEADAAVARGDIDAALAAYRRVLERDPNDVVAKVNAARMELLQRTRGADERTVRQRAAEAPDDVPAQLAVADIDMALGHVDDAVKRLVDVVRRVDGADRDAARTHLLALFEVLDPQDPRLAAGRRALANALF